MNDDEIPIPTMHDEDTDLCLREELISLAEAGEIKYTPKNIKKASQAVLEKINRDYDRKQTDEANEFLSDKIISKFSELLNNLDMIKEPGETKKELQLTLFAVDVTLLAAAYMQPIINERRRNTYSDNV
jgi:predicted fused transcriptional regulator/phosphomethylpyrimidine kinase